MYKQEKLLREGIILFLILFLSPKMVAADSSQGIVVNPMLQEITLQEHEEKARFSLAVTNNTSAPVTFTLLVRDFGTLDASGGVAFLGAQEQPREKYALASWMRPEQGSLTLQSLETKEVWVTIENRDDLAPGGHYGAVLFEVGGRKNDQEAGGVSLTGQLAALVFVKKIGGEINGITLHQIEKEKTIFRLPAEVPLHFENTGNVHITPRGLVTVADPSRAILKKGIINAESALLLPESKRQYLVPLSSLKHAWLPGYYRLTVHYRYDGKESFETVTTSPFFYIPPYLLLLFPGALFFLWKVKNSFPERARRGTVGGERKQD